MLSKVCYGDPLPWDENLATVLMGYNATPHSTTKFAPYQLLFGRNPNLPSATVLSTARSPYTVDQLSWWDTLARKLPMYWQTAKLRIEEMNSINKRYFDRKIHQKEITSGDWVLWCDMGALARPTKKLECLWKGPFEVMCTSLIYGGTSCVIDLGYGGAGETRKTKTVALRHVLRPRKELLETGQVRKKTRTRLTAHTQLYPDDPPMVGIHGPQGGGGAQAEEPKATKRWKRQPGKRLTRLDQDDQADGVECQATGEDRPQEAVVRTNQGANGQQDVSRDSSRQETGTVEPEPEQVLVDPSGANISVAAVRGGPSDQQGTSRESRQHPEVDDIRPAKSVDASVRGPYGDLNHTETPKVPPCQKNQYTNMDRNRAKLLGLRLLTAEEMHRGHEETIIRQIDGKPCECFRIVAGENFVLTAGQYCTLEQSQLLPAGARSSEQVFSQPQKQSVLLTKGRGMPYPTSWVDDASRQLAVRQCIGFVEVIPCNRQQETTRAFKLKCQEHDHVFQQDYE
ncbi:MAG: hypothetical protein GY934_10255, partial [Gammaproteobacteria bacterium]|nr:hypothetical protein [Gammaproteobacteria bacterium]